jgi:hypothetical protein
MNRVKQGCLNVVAMIGVAITTGPLVTVPSEAQTRGEYVRRSCVLATKHFQECIGNQLNECWYDIVDRASCKQEKRCMPMGSMTPQGTRFCGGAESVKNRKFPLR